jgi:hypothetical protein
VQLRTGYRDGAASDRGEVGWCLYGAGVARNHVGPARRVAPGGDRALTSGPGTEREKQTCGTPRQI